MEISKESWQALVDGQIRNAHTIEVLRNLTEEYAFKLTALAEWAADEEAHWDTDSVLDGLHKEWLYEKQEREEHLAP